MKKTKSITEIRSTQDFRDHFFGDEDVSLACSECAPFRGESGFLEVFSLENLQMVSNFFVGSQSRKKFYTVVLVTEGQMVETIGLHQHTFCSNMMYFITENQLHSIEYWSKDLKGVMCLFDSDYFLLCIKHQIRLNSFPFFQLTKDPFVELNDREATMMEHLFWKMSSELCQRESFNGDLLVRMFLNIILLEAERIYAKKTPDIIFKLSRKEQIVAQFQLLIKQHIIEMKRVDEYANLLHMHPHYLNDVVKEVTDFPASYFIQNQLIDEAKSRLIQTNATVSMIAVMLNFNEESYFGRFFKRHTGLTPLQYRKTHQQHL